MKGLVEMEKNERLLKEIQAELGEHRAVVIKSDFGLREEDQIGAPLMLGTILNVTKKHKEKLPIEADWQDLTVLINKQIDAVYLNIPSHYYHIMDLQTADVTLNKNITLSDGNVIAKGTSIYVKQVNHENYLIHASIKLNRFNNTPRNIIVTFDDVCAHNRNVSKNDMCDYVILPNKKAHQHLNIRTVTRSWLPITDESQQFVLATMYSKIMPRKNVSIISVDSVYATLTEDVTTDDGVTFLSNTILDVKQMFYTAGKVYLLEKYSGKVLRLSFDKVVIREKRTKRILRDPSSTRTQSEQHLFKNDETEFDMAKEPIKNIDDALDLYNNLMCLYKMFGDKSYKEDADRIMNKLKGV